MLCAPGHWRPQKTIPTESAGGTTSAVLEGGTTSAEPTADVALEMNSRRGWPCVCGSCFCTNRSSE